MSNPPANATSPSPRLMPLRSALKDDSDKTAASTKAVQISEPDPADAQPAPPLPPADDPVPRKKFPANLARRLSGRPSVNPQQQQQALVEGLSAQLAAVEAQLTAVAAAVTGAATAAAGAPGSTTEPTTATSATAATTATTAGDTNALSALPTSARTPQQSPLLRPLHLGLNPHHHHHHRRRSSIDHASGRLLAQVAEWIQHEQSKKEKRKLRRGRHKRRGTSSAAAAAAAVAAAGSTSASDLPAPPADPALARPRASSASSSSSSVSLDRLQRILDTSMAAMGMESVLGLNALAGAATARRHSRSARNQLSRTASAVSAASSDTDYVDGDVLVPSCDAVLDNSQTLGYHGGEGGDGGEGVSAQDRQAWIRFKNEIIRLAHTLRLKGWRRIPLDAGETISVKRLSGALTNAVYVVGEESRGRPLPPPPPPLLLRIYGPQVEHLIDRENELSVLRRLARKKIGPRLLGTFANGRFEQFFSATALTTASLREPATSRQIAKRMRELHDGVELLQEERDAGPNVWRNWDRWVERVEATVAMLERSGAGAGAGNAALNVPRTPIFGIPWPRFRALVEASRAQVLAYYGRGGADAHQALRERLVFAHNDTQYGNILRMRPAQQSPLLQPENEHKQLVVIDFEYAAANPPGVEFANHFTEWAYDYHDAAAPHACRVPACYPTPDQQRRFLRAYLEHRWGPKTLPASAAPAPDFNLDAPLPLEGERLRDQALERQLDELMAETRLWRPANSAQWVAWGIVQAKVGSGSPAGAPPGPAGEGESADDASDFDYLAYAQDRALFFLGDCVQAGLVRRDELPADVQSRLKTVTY